MTTMSDSCVLPRFSGAEAAQLARRLYGLDGPIRPLAGERDLNFLIDDPRGRFVFKIANELESPAMLECQHAVLQRLADATVFPRVVTAQTSLAGNPVEFVRDPAGRRHACRVLPFIEGRVLAELDNPGPGLLEDLGRRLAGVDRALHGFTHPALERPLLWKMDHALEIVDDYAPLLARPEQRALVDHFAAIYRATRVPLLARLRRGVIHNDANRGNILVDDDGRRVVSLIDFGDMTESWLAVEPAVAAAYVMLERADPVAHAIPLLRGYHSILPLEADEIDAVFDFTCMRLCMSVCIGAHQQRLEPDNAYLRIDAEPAWALLERLRAEDPAAIRGRMRAACDPRESGGNAG